MTRVTIDPPPPPHFNRHERNHLDALRRRLEFLTGQAPPDATGFIQGEAYALAWTLSILEGSLEPVDTRLERYERKLREFQTRLGRLEQVTYDEEEA